VSQGKDGRDGEARPLSKVKTAVKAEKKRVMAKASAEKKSRAVKAASGPDAEPAQNGAASAPDSAATASPPPSPAFPVMLHPALAALAPGLMQMAGRGDGAKPDFERILYNMARLMEQSGKALAASLRPPDAGEPPAVLANELQDAVRAIAKVTENWLTDPAKAVEAQTLLATSFLGLWANTLQRLSGTTEAPVVPYNPADKRFAAPEWRESPFFDFLRQAHAISVNWANGLVDSSSDLDRHEREKAKFYLRQVASALAPSNFFATNPEVLRETLESNGENLVRGVSMLAKDLEAGNGRLKITRYDESKFALGVNLAMTPGKVIFRDDLIELIQYAPTTPTVYRRPLLIVPPWINKFYILDLNPEKSFVRYAVAQGLTVFIVSWVNPDSRHRDKGFESYMREGILAATDAIEQATGETKITAIGYCIGGTLLAMTLAYMAERGESRIESASFFTTQTDFSQAGDLRVFIDEEHLRGIEQRMAATGYLDSSAMATSFNMLRPEDLIWSFVINYMRGKPPLAFDLLAWNSDATRMTAANHMAYLRGCYLENRLARGAAEMGGYTLHLEKVKIPIYHLATREDHIAPARSVFIGAQLFGGDIRFVVAGSGHIAGVVNPVAKPKYQYWTGPSPSGAFEDWLAKAEEHPGSWWPDWIEWLTAQSPERVPARQPGDGALPPLCDAPGEYVRVRF
jgi:polyhydroxyalkanoate synthase